MYQNNISQVDKGVTNIAEKNIGAEVPTRVAVDVETTVNDGDTETVSYARQMVAATVGRHRPPRIRDGLSSMGEIKEINGSIEIKEDRRHHC